MIQVIKFLSQTIGEDCVMGAENIYEVLNFVNTSYDTHDGMRDNTGGCTTSSGGVALFGPVE